MRKIYSTGLTTKHQCGHTFNDGNFHLVEVIQDHDSVRKISCGRSHVVFETMDGQVFAFGRNDYDQCAVGQKDDIKTPKPCLFKADDDCSEKNGSTNLQVYQPYMFSTGWFHSAFISADQKNVYFSGYCSYSTISNSNIGVFHNVSSAITKLGPNQKFTHLGSGDHVFMVVVDNNDIYYISSNISHVDVLKATGQALREVRMEKSGVVYTVADGSLYIREHSSRAKPNSEFLGQEIVHLNSSSVGGVSFKSVNLKQTIIDGSTRYPFECDVYPSFCSHFTYYPQTRTLTATGSNNDMQ
ncbi:hypothetical protein C9374_006452 [Naegleria lovaniensis]|uniref:Uncharacterized protein n=1 Tax=Naegleria lovaniensis TaxID=51637 RepID=A0AA88GNV5_NAELO|nr:uncharacterized protein C9374_006452 [Naegleria lovaniensis]KAG2381463.1 hypothetical protein C9374_006452 [Naegleria lovaniensis]